ncbi:EamA family transporter RarD [Ideonella livida]|uniref:EamA family transporter RarD n=1 Tax=Ideonella livida TaxID=2707176 RepID=A0A7C9TJ23_9BURK|nr:EamA family transporter RarD [Ideonella livida]NDY89927.1 EamA family transporter RarD [Ideonella livida]
MPRTGLLAAASAYLMWGLFPLYFHHLASVQAVEVVLHRSAWSLVFVGLLLAWQRRWAWLGPVLAQPRTVGVFAVSALLLSSNWALYVWAVQHGQVLESSLGYFINPLFNVLLGVLVLGERPRPVQWAAIGLAALGVLWLGWVAGRPPWIALALAASFGLYGLLKKLAPLGALEGLALETGLLAPLAFGGLAWALLQGGDSAHASAGTWGWLLLAGPFTAVPLLLFAYGAQRIPLGTLGLLQYLGPSVQFALGVWVLHEPLQPDRLLGFALIWTALLIYSGETVWRLRRPAAA